MRVNPLTVCVFSCFLFSCVLALAKQRGNADRFIATVKSEKQSIIPVVCGKIVNGQFMTQVFEGTAFFVDDVGHFVTPAHVIHDLDILSPQQPVPCFKAIFIPQDGWQSEALMIKWRWWEIGKCNIDDVLDLAVCSTVNKLSDTVPVSLVDIRPDDGTAVAFSGFPLGTIEPLTTRCNIATYRNVIDSEGSRELWLDKGNWPGASGSPIYLEDGSVIGILLARGTMDSVGITMGRPTHFLLSFLRSHGIAVQTKQAKDKKKKRNPSHKAASLP